MNHILTLTISALVLAGCAGTTDTYDRSAMPTAASGLQLETDFCKARWTAKDFKTYSEWQACQLAAERIFAKAIALTRMDAFDAYAADMHALAVDRDVHRVTDREVRSRANDIYRRFMADCRCKPETTHSHLPASFASGDGYPPPDDHMPSGNLSQPH